MAIAVLSDYNVEARHVKAVIAHKSTKSTESYNSRTSLQQKESMSNVFSRFVAGSSHLAIDHQPSSSKENPALPYSGTSSAIASSQQIENNQAIRYQAPLTFHFHRYNISIVNNYMRWAMNGKSSWSVAIFPLTIAKTGTEFPFDRFS